MTKLAKATGRSVEEWSSDDPSAMPPPRVRLRILRRHDNKCALTGILIADGQAFDLDHIVRIEDGGQNCESNLQPVLRLPHEVKSAAERKRAAKADRIAKRAHGMKPPGAGRIQSAGFPTFEKTSKAGGARIDKSALAPLPRRSIYRDI